MAAADPSQLTAGLRAAAPLNDTLGIEVLELGERARLRLPDLPGSRNHLAGPHAGAIFTLGETSAAALMIARLGDLLGRAVPLVVRAEIAYGRVARGPVLAEAVMNADPAALAAQFDAGERPEWSTDVVFSREADGAECGRMTAVLTLVHPRG